MRIRNLFLHVFVVILIASPCAIAQTQDTAEALDQYLSSRAELGRFTGTVLVAKDGEIIFRKGYGFADVEKRIPYTPETQHEVASISKMFTAMAALKLRNQRKLQLTDSICKYLEECPEIWKPITVQHLMRHTSGLPDYEEPLELFSEKHIEFMVKPDPSGRIIENARKLPLDFKPGEKFHYSNTGYIVLSYVIQKAAGKRFEEYVTKTILRPAGMRNSGLFSYGKPRNLAAGYSHGDLGWEKTLAGTPFVSGHLKRIPQLPLGPMVGDANLFTTVDDLYKWSLIMDGSSLVPTSEVAEVFTPGLSGYGYGWFIDKGFERKRYSHTGGLPGYVSDFVKYPDDKLTIIFFSNLDRARLGRIRRDVTAIVLGKPYDMEPVRGALAVLTPAQFATLEGEYKMADGAILKIKKEPDLLSAAIKDRFFAGLIPLTPTKFYMPLTDGWVEFTIDSSGRAVKANVHYNGEDHVAERVAS